MLAVLEQILITAEFTVENEEVAFRALHAYREGRADFSDYLLAISNQVAGCETTYSVDTRLAAHPLASLSE